jgi:hypothetical protein
LTLGQTSNVTFTWTSSGDTSSTFYAATGNSEQRSIVYSSTAGNGTVTIPMLGNSIGDYTVFTVYNSTGTGQCEVQIPVTGSHGPHVSPA